MLKEEDQKMNLLKINKGSDPNIVVLMICLSLFSGQVFAEKRVALVIGNATYQYSPLTNPVNDALDMTDVLRKLDFEVDSYSDLDRKTMRQTIREFGEKLKRADVGLFYYAGHGIQIKGRNYLVPILANVNSADEVQDESIDAGSILRKMESAGNAVNIVILDACRNNPFARSFRSLDQGLARMDGPIGSFIAYATAPGSVAADGEGRNGVYTQYLLKALNQPGLSIEKTFKTVRNGVNIATQGRQIPWESSSLMGEFVFFPDSNKTVLSTIKQPPPAPENIYQYLQVITNVPNAKVSINNIERGMVNSKGVLNIDNIREQQIEVEVQAVGYKVERKKITLVPNQWEKLNIVMIPDILSLPEAVKSSTDNARFCTENKTAVLATQVEFLREKGKAIVKRNIPELKIMLMQAFKKQGLSFIDFDLTRNKTRKKDNQKFSLIKAARRLKADYLIKYSSSVNETAIKIVNTNMKTIAGDLSLELVDVKNNNRIAYITKPFSRAGLDTKRTFSAVVKKEINKLTQDLVNQLCDI